VKQEFELSTKYQRLFIVWGQVVRLASELPWVWPGGVQGILCKPAVAILTLAPLMLHAVRLVCGLNSVDVFGAVCVLQQARDELSPIERSGLRMAVLTTLVRLLEYTVVQQEGEEGERHILSRYLTGVLLACAPCFLVLL